MKIFLVGIHILCYCLVSERFVHATHESTNNIHDESINNGSIATDSHNMQSSNQNPDNTHGEAAETNEETETPYGESENSEDSHGSSDNEGSHKQSEEPEFDKFDCTCQETESSEEESHSNLIRVRLYHTESEDNLNFTFDGRECNCTRVEKHYEELHVPKEAIIFPSAVGFMLFIFITGYMFYFFYSREQMRKLSEDHNTLEAELFKDIIFNSTLAGAAAPGLIGFSERRKTSKPNSPRQCCNN